MASRIELQSRLEELIGSRNVYFQPPEGFKLQYPCVVYALDKKYKVRASDDTYLKHTRYSVTIIDKNPDSNLPDSIDDGFLYCEFDRFYKADNLNHFVYKVYY